MCVKAYGVRTASQVLSASLAQPQLPSGSGRAHTNVAKFEQAPRVLCENIHHCFVGARALQQIGSVASMPLAE